MLVFGLGLAILLALAILAERASSSLQQAGRPDHHCPHCDRRYHRGELVGGLMPLCPQGHAVEAPPGHSAVATVAVVALLAFAATSAALLVTGVVPVP